MNYTLMQKGYPVLDFVMDERGPMITGISKIHDSRRIPIGVHFEDGYPNNYRLFDWWSRRRIPASREYLRELLFDLQAPSFNLLLSKGLSLSLSDQYWIKISDSDLKWEQINYFDNPFSDDIGDYLFNYVHQESGEYNLFSPETTTTGNLRKKWKIINDVRYLLKAGTPPDYQEPFNEVAACEIAKRLGIDHVAYELELLEGQWVSKCPCFVTRDTELISGASLIPKGEYPKHEGFERFLANCDALGLGDASPALERMFVLDFLIVNTDRHFNNFGFLREVDTLKWLGPAPIFDNGLSFWNNERADMIKSGFVGPCKTFRPTHGEQIRLVKDPSWLSLDSLRGADQAVFDIMIKNPLIDDRKAEALAWGVRWRVGHLAQFLDGLQPAAPTGPRRGPKMG